MPQRFPEILINVFMGLVLLTHMVVPHHHHNDTICVIESHCDVTKDSDDHTNHKHDGQEVQYCALKDPAVLNSGRITPLVKNFTIFSKFHGPEHDLVLFSSNISLTNLYSNNNPPGILPTPVIRHSRPLYGASGLRAPPVV